jgi:annexin A7/11
VYGHSIEKDVKGDTSGDFQKILVELLMGRRDESVGVDAEKAIEDAQKLYKAGKNI